MDSLYRFGFQGMTIFSQALKTVVYIKSSKLCTVHKIQSITEFLLSQVYVYFILIFKKRVLAALAIN